MSAIVLVRLALTVVFMAILAIIYSVLSVENKDQALGFPEGSVRALLAFSLLLIFVCLAAFPFSTVNKQCDSCVKSLTRVNDIEVSELKTNFIVAAEQARDEKGKLLYLWSSAIDAGGESDERIRCSKSFALFRRAIDSYQGGSPQFCLQPDWTNGTHAQTST